ncbi:MAG: TlpA family protein disulfide reductase [Bryobacteraceae bacterium]
MFTRLCVLILLLVPALYGQIIKDVRAAIARDDFAAGEKLIAGYRAGRGVTPEMLEALSWLGRGSQAAKKWDAAERYAAETRKLALEELKKRPLDAERNLPIALGASIEVQAHVLAARNQRTEAVAFLEREKEAWKGTSIVTRIQKNVHLLSLEGKPVPPLDLKDHLGPAPMPLAKLKGKTLLLFFWAHWCGDCKYQAPILARLQREFGPRGLVIVGPTQRYGYVARGENAPPAEERKYIDEVRQKFYAEVRDMTVPVSEDNFRNFGCSTTPTLMLVDRQGVVRMYHPGRMTYEDLAPRVAAALGS